jgi:hypothetical protein
VEELLRHLKKFLAEAEGGFMTQATETQSLWSLSQCNLKRIEVF